LAIRKGDHWPGQVTPDLHGCTSGMHEEMRSCVSGRDGDRGPRA